MFVEFSNHRVQKVLSPFRHENVIVERFFLDKDTNMIKVQYIDGLERLMKADDLLQYLRKSGHFKKDISHIIYAYKLALAKDDK